MSMQSSALVKLKTSMRIKFKLKVKDGVNILYIIKEDAKCLH